jgi:hypothetical protein
MGFLNRILGRPQHEKPFLLLVVGHPADAAMVPNYLTEAFGGNQFLPNLVGAVKQHAPAAVLASGNSRRHSGVALV